MFPRRTLLAAPLLARPALAQPAWPDRPLRIVVGYPPGGSLDVLSRLVGEQMGPRLGQPVIVENRPGAGGNIGADAVAKAAPDGYSIACAGIGTWVINQHLYRSIPFDSERDLLPASMVWEFPNVAVVPAQLPVRTLAEFIAWAKARPGGISYGSSGVGTTIHLCGALLCARNGIDGTHIPFRGAAQTIPAMLSGDVHLAVDNLASYIPIIQEGRLRALAVTGAERWPALPDVPTMAEAGQADFVVTSWSIFAVPSATPRPILDRLSAVLREIAQDAGAQRRAFGTGARLLGSTPEAALQWIAREKPRWAEMVRLSGARAE